MSRNLIVLILLFMLTTSIQFGIPSYRNFMNDDAFVAFVFARNIANGHGFSFNEGEFSSGTTVLWPLMLSFLYSAIGDSFMVWGAKALALVLTFLLTVMSYLLTLEVSKKAGLSLIVALLVAVNPWVNMWASAATDTTLFALLSMVTVYFYISGRVRLSFILSGLTYLARPEGAFLFLVLFIHNLLKNRNLINLVIPVLIFGMVISPWLLMMITNEGTIFNKSFLAKRQMYEYFATSFGPIKFSHQFMFDLVTMVPLLLGVLSLAIVVKFNKKDMTRNEYTMYMWPVVLMFSHTFLFLSGVAHRYIAPIIPFLLMISLLFIEDLKKLWPNVVFAFALLLLLMTPFQYMVLNPKMVSINRDAYSHFQISDWIIENIPESDKIAIGELGIIKWEVRRHFYDIAGIIDSPKVMSDDPRGFMEYLEENGVNYVINPVKYSSENPDDPRARERCSLLNLEKVLNFSGVEWGVYTVPFSRDTEQG